MEMDILGESLQVANYPRAGGADEVLTGNMQFEGEKKGERDVGAVCQTFDLQNL